MEGEHLGQGLEFSAGAVAAMHEDVDRLARVDVQRAVRAVVAGPQPCHAQRPLGRGQPPRIGGLGGGRVSSSGASAQGECDQQRVQGVHRLRSGSMAVTSVCACRGETRQARPACAACFLARRPPTAQNRLPCWPRTFPASSPPTRGSCTSRRTATTPGPTSRRPRTPATGRIRRRWPTASGRTSSAPWSRRRKGTSRACSRSPIRGRWPSRPTRTSSWRACIRAWTGRGRCACSRARTSSTASGGRRGGWRKRAASSSPRSRASPGRPSASASPRRPPRATGTSCGSPTSSSIPASSCATSRRSSPPRRPAPWWPSTATTPSTRCRSTSRASTRAPSTSPAATSTRWRAKAPASSRSPPAASLRPADTGWFASFDSLSGRPGEAVPYSADAFRFWGSTFDPSGLYRFNAVMDWLAGLGVTVADIHAHAGRLQSRFLSGLSALGLERLPADALVPPAVAPRGNFLAFDVGDAAEAHQRLLAARGLRRPPRPAPSLRLRRLPRRGRGGRPPRSDGEGPGIESLP